MTITIMAHSHLQQGGTKMKKMTILAVVLALAIALTACGSEKAPETTAATAAPTTAANVPAETAASVQSLTLTNWEMSANTWSSPNGATINISAAPSYYEEGQKADFVVRLESDDVALVPCEWDGTNYTASVDLNAANGYCYYIVLTAADGTASEVAVNTPAEPTNEAFIDIEAALESYCSITIDDSTFENSKLTLTSGKVQVKAPLITNEGETITCQEATLILTFNGETLGQEVLTLSEAETGGLFEAPLENITFDIPEMENEQSVELTLNVTLTNGQILSAFGGSWVNNAEGFLPVLG